LVVNKSFKLNQLGFVGRGKSKHRPRNDISLYGGDYPFIQTGEVKAADLYLTEYTQTYNEKGLAQSKLWEPETLCITIAANIAETAILKLKACFPDSIVGFVADPEKADVSFIKYYIDTIKLKMQNVSRGTTQDNLSLDKLLMFDFLVPPVTTQRKIASILSAYDDLIENNTRRIKILEEMARMIYREWFVNFRFPGHEKVKMVDSPLGRIPEGWAIGTINDVVSIKSGFAFKSDYFVKEGAYGLVTIKNVQDGQFDPVCSSRITDIPQRVPAYCILKTGDILISLTGNIGRACLVYGNDLLLNQRVAKLVPLEPNNEAFAYFTFRQDEMRSKLEQISNGVAQQNLSPVETGKMDFCVPSKLVLARFSHFCVPIISQLLAMYKKNQNLRQTRDLLLPKLISGEVDVSKLDNVA